MKRSKKIILTLLAAVACMAFSVSAYAEETSLLYGDVDGSGNVDANDALAVLKDAAKLEAIAEEQKVVAEVTGDGSIDATDALDILKYAAKLINKFAVEDMATATPEATPEATPMLTRIPTAEPVATVIPATYPTMIPLPEVSADPANVVEGTAIELEALNGATVVDGIYTFTDDNKANRTGIAFKNIFATKKEELTETLADAVEGQPFDLTEEQKKKYDPEAYYRIPEWKKGISMSFWAKYEWDIAEKSNDEAILVLHRSERSNSDFAFAFYLDGKVEFEEGADAHNSFRTTGGICGTPNEWNYYTITIKNDWITVYVNGQECAYQKVVLDKGGIGLFNGGYMTKYNVPGELTEEQLANDIRGYYTTSGVYSNGELLLEATIVDTRAYDVDDAAGLDSRLLMDCLLDEKAELMLGGTMTFKLLGSLGNPIYDLKTGTQVAGFEAYFTALTPEQVSANYAAEAEAFLK